MKRVSIIIPVWNEGSNIQSLVERIHETLQKNDITYEIIFIDDHSADSTVKTINQLKDSYPVSFYLKQGKKGKAYSIIEGCTKARYEAIAMIDADLQYPPEALPDMFSKMQNGADIAVAKRQYRGVSKIRQFVSKSFQFVFGKLLFQLDHDVQAGLKVFRREVIETVIFTPVSGWTFDLEFLHRAREAGYTIENCEILFEKRKNGESKISLLQTSFEIGLNALAVKLKTIHPQHMLPVKQNTMLGAGVGFKKKKYVTHTTLHHSQSAVRTFIWRQIVILGIAGEVGVAGVIFAPLLTLQIIIGILSFIYFVDVLFNFYLIWKSLHVPQEITFSSKELSNIDDSSLPVYSILCPLYKEAHVIPQFLNAISKLSWPKEKLDVLLLLEEDDKESIEKVKDMKLPAYVHTVVVPHSMPKTKPKACNYGLTKAIGEYLVIYDAEDMPDPMQLKKAYLGFQKSGSDVRCLQAKLNYYNPHQNLLTKFFTAEYSLWFDITLTGLQSINTSIPLGGTSNHFRTKDLISLRGWDPFNVTEDADLGIRLFKQGYKTAIIDSTTLEEANSKWINWIRQRSRWIKGYMQTYLVHTREIFSFQKKSTVHDVLFHLTIGGKIAFILINPLLWIATIAYFSLYAIVGPAIESLYPPLVFYMAAFSLIFGNFLFLYYYMIGCAKRNQWELVKYVYLVPFYWLMISIAGGMALFQLIFKPHYWEKTVHGLHLKKRTKQEIAEVIIEAETRSPGLVFPAQFKKHFASLMIHKKMFLSGSMLVMATMIANFLNFVFNAYLGRVLDFDDFALISLIGSFYSFSSMFFNPLGATVNYKSGFLIGKYDDRAAYDFWKHIRKYSLIIGFALAGLWLVASPFLNTFFHGEGLFLFISFSSILFIGLATSVDRGFISAKLLFSLLAVIVLIEPIVKLISAIFLVQMHLNRFTYIGIPVSVGITFLFGWILAKKQKPHIPFPALPEREMKISKKFLLVAMISGLSSVSFVSLDIILAKHFLSPADAGRYALVSLVGKMVYFLGGLSSPFVLPLASRNAGANKHSLKTLYTLVGITALFAFAGFLCFGVFGYFTVPILFGKKTITILPFLVMFLFAMMCFTVSKVFATYYLAEKLYSYSIAGFLLSIIQIVLITINHADISSIVFAMTVAGVANFLVMVVMHWQKHRIKVFESNIADLFGLFSKEKIQKKPGSSLSILIFNWRDIRHVWAGGAESYVHELAKRWVGNGNRVTIFCGNDGKHPRQELIDGVQIIRRGGFYTVYLWAFLYYIFKFRGQFDVIVDSENGIPFFTPLFSRKPIFLLIHHIHQDVYRKHLIFPFSYLAMFLEGKAMPFLYKNKTIITVSESSKREIIKLGLGSEENIEIINPGVDVQDYLKGEKTQYPSFVYLGRLKPWKNIDVIIKAFSAIVTMYPDAKLSIAGFGESMKSLQKLTTKLRLEEHVTFLGQISEEEKKKLLSESWIALQPSMMEGWGITVIEANASGTPVIASNVNGLRDSVIDRKTGLLVDVRSVAAFTKAMVDCLEDKKYRQRLSEEAFMWSRNFSWDKSARNFYKKIWESLGKNQQTTVLGKYAVN